jgi:hypothetical protein
VEESGSDAEIASYDVAFTLQYLPIDLYEPDDDITNAPLVRWPPRLTAHRTIWPVGDVDYVVLSIFELSELSVTAYGPDGFLDVSLLDAAGNVLETSTTPPDRAAGAPLAEIDRTREDRDWLQPGTYYVRVNAAGHDGWVNDYTLDVRISGVPYGGDDSFEPNDTLDRAPYFSLGFRPGELGYQWDDDYFQLWAQRERLRLVIESSSPEADSELDVQLLDASGAILASSASIGPAERIDMVVPHSGVYYLRPGCRSTSRRSTTPSRLRSYGSGGRGATTMQRPRSQASRTTPATRAEDPCGGRGPRLARETSR